MKNEEFTISIMNKCIRLQFVDAYNENVGASTFGFFVKKKHKSGIR